MRTVEAFADQVCLELTRKELRVIGQALNEVLNGLYVDEFSTRMGATREYARQLLNELLNVPDLTN